MACLVPRILYPRTCRGAAVTVLNETAAVTTDDAFHIGSCTKPFTATIVAMLVEEKKLSWDTRRP